MPCTTLLAGKKATYDGSTMIARNDDSGAGGYMPKKYVIINPEDQPRIYRSEISHVEISLPDDPMRYTSMPNAVDGEGIWAGAGINEVNVGMTATETITSNPRVLGADPLVRRIPASEDTPEVPGGIGEEDLVVLVLPYIRSAREGVLRTGQLLEKYGTYEMNGMAFQDVNEIWWLETIGGHHWIARRVPDDAYVIMPNQFGMDQFDLEDALGEGKEFLCSRDMKTFLSENHLDLTLEGTFNPREAFGSHDDSDHVYNTPRGWYMARYFNPHTFYWDGSEADYTPESDDIPWCLVPERKITVEDFKYILSSHFQGTPFDPYGSYGDGSLRGKYRSIGINRTDFLALLQIRPYVEKGYQAIEWIAYGSNAFNAFVPFYTNVSTTPVYLSNTDGTVSTENFYWSSRLIGALADASYKKSHNHIERYQMSVQSQAHALIAKFDKRLKECDDQEEKNRIMEEANEALANMAKKETAAVLERVLYEASNLMKNSYSRSDA